MHSLVLYVRNRKRFASLIKTELIVLLFTFATLNLITFILINPLIFIIIIIVITLKNFRIKSGADNFSFFRLKFTPRIYFIIRIPGLVDADLNKIQNSSLTPERVVE